MGVPQHLVGVERSVGIASLAIYMEVSRQVCAPGEGDACVAAIGEVPSGEVARGLQAVLRASIGSLCIERDVEPTVTETQ